MLTLYVLAGVLLAVILPRWAPQFPPQKHVTVEEYSPVWLDYEVKDVVHYGTKDRQRLRRGNLDRLLTSLRAGLQTSH